MTLGYSSYPFESAEYSIKGCYTYKFGTGKYPKAVFYGTGGSEYATKKQLARGMAQKRVNGYDCNWDSSVGVGGM